MKKVIVSLFAIIPVVEEVWLTDSKGFGESCSYGDYPRGNFTKKLLSRGWERLERHRWTFERTVSK